MQFCSNINVLLICICISGPISLAKTGIFFQKIMTFEDNFKSRGDMPMAMYFDFETTAPTDSCFDRKQNKKCLCLKF